MNGYSRDLLQERVAVAKRYEEQSQTFGGSSTVTKYEWLNKVESDHGFWCKHDWTRGLKAMHEGALDAYDIVTFRMDFDPAIDRWCLLLYEGKWYQIQNLNGSQRENKLQIQAIEMANQNVTIIGTMPVYEVEIWGNRECTERPSGNLQKIYAQFNKKISTSKAYENSSFKFIVEFEDSFEETDLYLKSGNTTLSCKYIEGINPIEKKSVIEMDRAAQTIYSPDSNYSFGEIVNPEQQNNG